jgi:hypothetical protein
MTEFGQCVVLVLERIGMAGAPPAYIADVERLNEACAEWHRQPDAVRGGFLKFDLPDLLEPGAPLVTGNLPEAITYGWAANDAAKAFIRFVDERSGSQATLLMLQIVLLLQQAVQEGKAVNAAGGDT